MKSEQIRILFSKDGALIYISHLDLTHAFIRALNRAGIKPKYSQGFNPHPKMTFASPLSVGMAGENELCDITLENAEEPEIIAEKLRAVMPGGLCIKKAYIPDVKLANVDTAKYTVFFEGLFDGTKIAELLNEGSINVEKSSKSGTKTVDIRPMIKKFDVKPAENGTELTLVLCCSSAEYLNPEYVIKAIFERALGKKYSHSVSRDELYFVK